MRGRRRKRKIERKRRIFFVGGRRNFFLRVFDWKARLENRFFFLPLSAHEVEITLKTWRNLSFRKKLLNSFSRDSLVSSLLCELSETIRSFVESWWFSPTLSTRLRSDQHPLRFHFLFFFCGRSTVSVGVSNRPSPVLIRPTKSAPSLLQFS